MGHPSAFWRLWLLYFSPKKISAGIISP
jgi:hypothetical protein